MDGDAVAQGFDPLTLPPDRFFNWVWRFFTKNMDEKQRASFEIEINRPLPGQRVEQVTDGPWSDEAAAASFMALASQLGVEV